MHCGLTATALLDYNKLRKNGSYPENMWWFYNIIPKVYEGSKLIADNSDQMEFAHRDLRWVYPITFNRVKSPAQLKEAVKTGITCINNLKNAKKLLNVRGASSLPAASMQQFNTNGKIKVHWQTINGQMESHWLYTKGAQRAKLKFVVESPNGIKSVKVVDAFFGVIRNFDGKGAKKFSRELEISNSRKHYLWLEVTDGKGKTALTHSELVWCYKQGLYRCGDNLNILGPLGVYWHPDRNQMLPIIKMFNNAETFSVHGWDRGDADCPRIQIWPENAVDIKGVGAYPIRSTKTTSGARMKVQLASHDVQIVSMEMDEIMERFDTAERPGPGKCTISRKVKDNEYFTRTDTMYALRDNTDHFIMYNHRRLRESLEDYKGSYVIHEGEFRFKKDITLSGSVPIRLLQMKTPFIAGELFNKLLVDDLKRGQISVEIKADKTPRRYSGTIKPGGYLTIMNSPIGYVGIMTPHDQKMTYSFSWPNHLFVGIGHKGQKIKKGEVIKYRYIAAILIDSSPNAKQLQKLVKASNLDGGTSGLSTGCFNWKTIERGDFPEFTG